MWGTFLSSRWCIPLAALAGMLLTLPAMFSGLIGDDYLHWALLTGLWSNPQAGSFFGLFTFADGNPAHNQALIDSGRLIWWANDALKISFWRPLSELSQWLDYRLWPDSPLMMHLHSLLWYGAIILVVGKLFTELDGSRVQAGLATVFFAGNMLHVFAVGWLASRNQMLSTFFMVVSVLAYHRWRSGRSVAWAIWAGLTLLLGLFSAEAAVETVGYFVAYSAFIEHDKPLWHRARALLPFLLMVLVWKATHSHLGYGSHGSPGYIDPTPHVGQFGLSVALRLPALMVAQWFGVSSVVFQQLPHGIQIAYAVVATLALAALAAAMHWLGALRSPLMRFYALGSVLALVPACAGYPFDRLTLNADVAVSGMLAVVVCQVLARRQQLVGWTGGAVKYLVYALLAIHLVVFPVLKLVSSAVMTSVSKLGNEMGPFALPAASQDPQERFLLINPPAAETVYYFPLARAYFGLSNPSGTYAMGPDNQAMTLTRLDDTTLSLSVAQGFRSSIARDERLKPFAVGDKVSMGGIEVTVQSLTADHLPQTVTFRFPGSLQASQWRFFSWDQSGCHATTVPAVGQSLSFQPIDMGKVFQDHLRKG